MVGSTLRYAAMIAFGLTPLAVLLTSLAWA